MSGLRHLIDKYTTIAKELPQQRENLALIYAHDAHAITANRIQNTGTDARGNKMKPYSKRPFNWSALNENKFNAPAKIRRFKKEAKEKKNNGSYEALRQVYGLPTNIRTLTFDGSMWKSIDFTITYHDEFKTIVEIRANNKENQLKVDQNSRIVGINILAFGKGERDFLAELNKERIQKLLS